MKIAMLSTPWIAIPPKGYGGIELVVSNLTEELVKRGHEVTIIATGDSKTSGKLRYLYPRALGNNLELKKNPFHLLQHLHFAAKIIQEHDFDIVHNHLEQFGLIFLDLMKIPSIHTLHSAFYKNLTSPSGNIKIKRSILQQFKYHNFISISDNQRKGLPGLNYLETIYNGINTDNFQFHAGKGTYLAWLGRVTPNKGLDIAIQIARKAGLPLKAAVFIDEGERPYYEKEIVPLLDDQIEVIDELTDIQKKNSFLGDAIATLFPIRWDEPFGLVMIESMASGTPVIAYDRGSVREIIRDGETGFVVQDESHLLKALNKIGTIDRRRCSDYAKQNFSIEKMVESYLAVYNRVLSSYET